MVTSPNHRALSKLAKALIASCTNTKQPPVEQKVLSLMRGADSEYLITHIHRLASAGYWSDECGGFCEGDLIAWLPNDQTAN